MTRREEIEKAANEFYKGDEVSTFVVAAQWADRTIIARFCEWIEEHIENAFVSIDGTMTDINGIELSEVVRKAMEE